MSLSMPISIYLYPYLYTNTKTSLPSPHLQANRDCTMLFCQLMNIFYGKNRILKEDWSIVLFNKCI